jgi:hypothetical protein
MPTISATRRQYVRLIYRGPLRPLTFGDRNQTRQFRELLTGGPDMTLKSRLIQIAFSSMVLFAGLRDQMRARGQLSGQ